MKNPVMNTQYFSAIPLQTFKTEESKKGNPLKIEAVTINNYNPAFALRSKVSPQNKLFVVRTPVKKIAKSISDESEKSEIDWFNNYE